MIYCVSQLLSHRVMLAIVNLEGKVNSILICLLVASLKSSLPAGGRRYDAGLPGNQGRNVSFEGGRSNTKGGQPYLLVIFYNEK